MPEDIVIYVDADKNPVPRDEAEFVIVSKPDGRIIWGRPAKEETKKSIDSVSSDYEEPLTRFAYDLLRDKIGVIDFRRAHKGLIRQLADRVYFDGMLEGGIEYPEESMDDDDRDTIREWIDDQVSHVDDFADWLDEQEFDPGSQAAADARIEFWVNAMRSLGRQAMLRALGNPMVTWEWDPNIDAHCDTCRELNGQSHRWSWFESRGYMPQKPGAAMKCGGYYCGCLVKDKKTGRVLFP